MNEEIILASASPRRRQLLEQVGIPFKVVVSHAPEVITQTDPRRIVMELARQKAEAVWKILDEADRGRIILGADTIVFAAGQILGKPADADQARQMLGLLAGKAHSVFTGAALLCHGEAECFAVETKVFVAPLSEAQIEAYIASGEPFDKAGGYGIQGSFAAHVEGIEGDYFNVMGLPLHEICLRLEKRKGK